MSLMVTNKPTTYQRKQTKKIPVRINKTTKDYIKDVADRFKTQPEIYRRFLYILSDVRNPEVSRLDIVSEVAKLFSSHRDLLRRFGEFVPGHVRFELQRDAYVIKPRPQQQPTTTTTSGALLKQSLLNSGTSAKTTLQYVKFIKSSISASEYKEFLKIMNELHNNTADIVTTIERIISLFKANVPLVVGFNNYLPEGYLIKAAGHFSYVIERPVSEGVARNVDHTDVRFMYDDNFL